MAWSLQDDEAIDWFCPGTTGHITDGSGEKHKLPTSGGKLPMVSNPKAAKAIGQVATTTGSKPEWRKAPSTYFRQKRKPPILRLN